MERLTTPNRFYVYAYLREDGTPYYIGKGTGNRVNQKAHHYVNLPSRERRIKLIEEETSDFCLRYEKLLIGYYGKKHDGTGILRNIADGGKGSKGFKHTEAYKKHQSEIMTGVPKSDEMKAQMREVASNRPEDYYDNFANYNKADRVFVHEVHGEFRCSQSELCAMFPELAQGNLSKVVRGIIKQHKGFRCLTPSVEFMKKAHSNTAAIQKRLANNADKVGMDVAAYAALSPHHRKKLLAAARAA